VTLTVHGRAVADIVARRTRAERRPTDLFLDDLRTISEKAASLGITSAAEDFGTGWTTNDVRT
jgi:antitoxin (DNA-binding transcriptional repressor) of toxin-antitoxin stability system